MVALGLPQTESAQAPIIMQATEIGVGLVRSTPSTRWGSIPIPTPTPKRIRDKTVASIAFEATLDSAPQ
jgi:hypothetical protein